MNQQVRSFRLAEQIGHGIACDETGVFVGETPLLERHGPEPIAAWRPRPLADLNPEVSERYGLSVDLASKLGGLTAIAGALGRGDVVLAKLAALQLQLPDPPGLAKATRSDEQLIELAYQLQAAGVLAKTWDEAKHPRQPAGSPAGGEFAPSGGGSADAMAHPADSQGAHAARPAKAQAASPLASSLDRQPRKLSPSDQKLLAGLQAKLADPQNQGVVSFDSRNAALKDMGYFFSADITKFDPHDGQLERGDWLLYDPTKTQWSYDRSQMVVGTSGTVGIAFSRVAPEYLAGDAIYVHIHPLISNRSPEEMNVEANNEANRTFSRPSQGRPGDTTTLSTASRLGGAPVQAAVIGSDGSISYSGGGDKPDDYEGKNVSLVAPRGTVPMRDPNL